MRCSSCIGSSRRSQSSDDHESTSALRQSKTADLELDHSSMDQPHHRSSPPQTAYRVDSPTAKQEDAHSSTASHSEHYRPPSITIEELDDDDDNAVEYGAETLGTASASAAIRNYEVQPSRGGPLEIIREEEHTDCSDGENSHILPSSDSATVRPLPQKECKSTKVNKTSGDENGAECVTTKFNSVNVLRDFLRYRRQRKRRRGTSAIQNAAPQFQPSEQQVPTTCMLVDARESNIAPTEFRSICTTEIVSSEVLQVEVVNIGSNSSSLDDLSDLEQEGHPDPENLVFIDHIEDDSDNAIHPDPDSDSNQQHCVIVGDASNSTLSLSNEDLRQTTEDEEQPPASSDGTVQNHVPTDDGRSLGENLPTLSEDRAALAQQDNLQRTQMSDSGTVDDLANGCALTTTAAGDVETGHREERHDEVSDAAENMSEQRHTFESNGEPDSTVVGWSTVERSSASVLVADRDRTSAVVSNDENVIKPLKDPPSSVIDRDCAAKFGIDCTVNHSVRVGKTPSVIEQTMHPGDKSRAAAPAAASATSTGAIIVQKENQTARSSPPPAARSVAQVAPGTAIPLPPPPKQEAASVTNLGQHPVVSAEDGKSDAPTPPVPPPPPAQQLVPLTVEALSSSSTAGYNPSANNAQALSSDHPSQTDHAHADQDSAENCVDAVTSVEQQQQQQDSLLNGSTVDGQSTLLKYIQAHSAAAEDSSEKRYQGKTQNSAKVAPVSTGGSDSKRHQTDHPIPVRSDAASPGEGNADREAKIEQTCEDHGGQNSGDSYEHTVLRVAPNLRNTDHETPRTGSDTGMNNVARKKRPSKFVEPTAPSRAERVSNLAHNTSTVQSKQEPTTEDLRSEISRMKDQELQDEFRKLELETARYERELQQITLPLQESHQQTNGKYSKQYFVSKQNDFVIERSSLSSVKTSNMVGVTNGGVSQSDIRKHGERVAGAQQETKSCTEQRPVPVPPPPPAAASTDSSIDNEEFFTKKVKDRVRDLMASQAAAEEAKNAAKMRAGGGFASAPSTPTASRKHIEADFKEFREMRQREAFAERKSLETTNNVPAKPQQQQQQHQPRAPTGVWSPFNRSTEVLTKEELAERTQNKSSTSQQQQPAVWTPRSAPPSPLFERREFRRIGFETPPPTQRTSTPTPANAASVVTPPWNQPGYNPPLAVSEQPKPISGQSSGVTGPNAIRPTPIATTPPPPPPGQGGYQVRFPRSTNSQEPTINSLLKSKDGKTATINGSATSESLKKGSTITASTIRTSSSLTKLDNVVDTSYASSQPPPIRPKPEPSSAALHARSDSQERKMQQSAPKVEGIGPISREGMPLTLRSEIDEGNRDKWYKQMYQTLHKTHDDDDYVTVRYKTRRGYPYKSTGYQSEPEANYDSDYTIKYSTLDRRRTPVGLSPTSYNKFSTLQSAPTTPQPYHHQQSVKSGHSAYKNQPGRIEDYTPGRSSISEKESKEQLEHQKLTTSKTYTEGNLSRALKEQGYESDSTLVFRKREPTASAALSPVEQKQHYKTMQAGGEIPLQGFRKPAPERPKEPHITFPSPPLKGAQPPPPPPLPTLISSSPIANSAESPRRYIESDVNIHYKTPIRFEYKEPIPDDELAHRQAEHMRRVYQEERRRKYMHELEDLHSRRHMDNILPSQKSPIPLNRYDDFAADLSPKPQIVQQPKTIARALYNFQGQSIRELSFRKGDIIYLRRQIDKNWYEGEHNATVGLLPANYIEIISRDNFNVRPLPKKPSREGKARAKFNFTAQTAVELSLLKGELVTLTRRVDDNWFEGKIGSKKGIFPVSYVEILTDIDGEESYDIEPIVSRPQSALGVTSQSSHALTTHYDNSHTNGRISPGVVRETKTIQKTEVLHVDTSNEPISYRALYNYKPQNTDELELLEGDVVYVLEKCDDGWYVGTSARTGCFGTFPGNYVSKM